MTGVRVVSGVGTGSGAGVEAGAWARGADRF